ncbi:hypothetical protein VTI74DRAFT_830 [Chaetomium olivicolor]
MPSLQDPIFRLDPLPSPPVPLPQVPGPKLAPFTPTAHAYIEFVKNLGRPNDQDSQAWKVKINNEGPYALKIFYFLPWEYLKTAPGKYLTRPLATPQLYVDYVDPFQCECRAYGRIKHENREDLAVKAYGYLLLTPEQEAEVAKRIGATRGTDMKNIADTLFELSFKEFITDYEPFSITDIPRLWSDLEELDKLGILVRDFHIGNYLGGKIIDFSRSWTMYHPCLHQIPPSVLQEIRQSDASGLWDILYAWSNEYPRKQIAAPEDLDYCTNTLGDDCGYDPRTYDWRRWEEDEETADEYVANKLFTDWGSFRRIFGPRP